MAKQVEEINYDPRDHDVVPKHRVLDANEAKIILEKFNVKSKHLPKIALSDVVVKVLEAKPGDILEITRKSPTAGESKYYRIVV